MHELSLAKGMVDQVLLAAASENASRVARIEVVIGPYSGVERDAFEFAFPFAAEGTILQTAELILKESPATVTCHTCRMQTHPDIMNLACVHCGSTEIEITAGREFRIQSIEMEVPES